jgi:hypothetical protein
MYKLSNPSIFTGQPETVINLDNGMIIPFAAGNTDYELFKAQINDKSEGLENYNGVLMTPDEAIAYVATLP